LIRVNIFPGIKMNGVNMEVWGTEWKSAVSKGAWLLDKDRQI
jgi:hypothetical protein